MGSNYVDSLIGNRNANRIEGGGGDDVLDGGVGADTYVFAAGHGDDMLHFFRPDSENDMIDLEAFHLTGFADVRAAQNGNDVRIDLTEHGGGTIMLKYFDVTDLDAEDFLF